MEVENYVSFNIAQLLKEKRFNEICAGYYDRKGRFAMTLSKVNNIRWEGHYIEGNISAPTLQETIKWLREVHHIEILITCGFPSIDGVCQFKYFWHVVKVNLCDKRLEYPMDCLERVADTFESACDSAIEFCLTNLI